MALEEHIEIMSPRYYTGYTKWERIAIYAEAVLAAGALAVLGAYLSCTDNAKAEKPNIENVQQSEEAGYHGLNQ